MLVTSAYRLSCSSRQAGQPFAEVVQTPEHAQPVRNGLGGDVVQLVAAALDELDQLTNVISGVLCHS